jgi:hypothetical protein
VPTYVYLNNLTPLIVGIDISFPGNAIAAGDWQQLETSLEPFDGVNHCVAWVDRNVGIHNGESYTMLVSMMSPANQLIVSANIGLTGTFASSDITIGAQNDFFTDDGHADDGPYSDSWTDASGQTWAVDFNYLGMNSSGYDDVVWNVFMTVPGQAS